MQLNLMINNHRDSKDNIDSKISAIKNSSDFMSMTRTAEEQTKIIEDKQRELEKEKLEVLSKAKESSKPYIEDLFKQRSERINKYSGNKYYDTALGQELIELEETSKAIEDNIKAYTDEYIKISSPKYQREFNKKQKEIIVERVKFELEQKKKQEEEILQKADYIESVLTDIPKEQKATVIAQAKQRAEDNEDTSTKAALEEVSKREQLKQVQTSELDKLTDTLNNIRIQYNFGNYTKEGDEVHNKKQEEVIQYLDEIKNKYSQNADAFTSLEDVKNDFIQRFAPDYNEATKDKYKDTVISDIINSFDEFTTEAKPIIKEVLDTTEEEVKSREKNKQTIDKEIDEFNIETSKIYAGSIANKVSYRDRVYLKKDGKFVNAGNHFESLHNIIIDSKIVHPGTELKFMIAGGTQEVQDGFLDGKPNITTWENKLKRILSSINILSTESMNSFFQKAFTDLNSLNSEEKLVFSKIISSTPIIIYTNYKGKVIQVGYVGEHYSSKDKSRQAGLTKLFNDRKTILEAAFNQTLVDITSTISAVSNGELSTNNTEEGEIVYTPVTAIKNSDVNVVIKRNTPSGTALYGSKRDKSIENLNTIDVGHPHIEVPIGDNITRLVSVFRTSLKDLPIYKSSIINAVNLFIKLQSNKVLTGEESDFLERVGALEKTLKTQDKSFSFDLKTPQGLRNYLSLFINVTETTSSNLHATIAAKNIKDSTYKALSIEHIPSANNTMKILLSNGKDLNVDFTMSTGKDGKMYITKDSISSKDLIQALTDNLDSFQFNVDKNYLISALQYPNKSINIPTFHNNNVVGTTYNNYQEFIKNHLETNILEHEYTNVEGKKSYSYTEQKQILYTNLETKEKSVAPEVPTSKIDIVTPTIPIDDSIKESDKIVEISTQKSIEAKKDDIKRRRQEELDSKPKVFLHGTKSRIEVFDKNKRGSNQNRNNQIENDDTTQGFFLSDDLETSEMYAELASFDANNKEETKNLKGVVLKVKVNLKSSEILNVNFEGKAHSKNETNKHIEQAKREGYKAVAFNNIFDGGNESTSLIVFDENDLEILPENSEEITTEYNKIIAKYDAELEALEKIEVLKEEKSGLSEDKKAMLRAKYSKTLSGVAEQSGKKLPSIALLESPTQNIIDDIVGKTLKSIEGLSLITSNVNTVSIDHQQQYIQYLVNVLATNIINKLSSDLDNITITHEALEEMLEEQKELLQLIQEEYAVEGSLVANHITEYLAK